MAPAKRASSTADPKPRKVKKPRTRKGKQRDSDDAPEPQALGSTSLLARHAKAHEKDETELELEEAVFGKRSGQREADLYDLAEEDLQARRRDGDFIDEVDYEDEDDEETGLERLRDENVRTFA